MNSSFHTIAYLHNSFSTKFGLPRQSGIVKALKGTVVFEPEYRVADALRGIENFTHLWLIWQFSEALREKWSPTVRPPRLGGNRRVGVFATRSPFRPNPIGLSCVKLDSVEYDTPDGPVLHVSGADLMDGTPIYDIKPYVAFSDCVPEAGGILKDARQGALLEVEIPPAIASLIPASELDTIRALLAEDPRPAYQADPSRVYGMSYAGMEIKFRVDEKILRVVGISRSY